MSQRDPSKTPAILIGFQNDYFDPNGILKTIKETGAFKRGGSGAETVPESRALGKRVIEVPGKRGHNAFSNTDLDMLLRERGVEHATLVGVVPSICIDSAGRAVHERGYQVGEFSDCTAGRTTFEQEFYCENVFPIYAEVLEKGPFLEGFAGAD